jgi:penicillin-binding protein 2D
MQAKHWVSAASLGLRLGLWLALPVGMSAQGSGEPWRIIDLPQSSLIYARDRSILGEVGRQVRTSVPLASLPRYLPQAFIAVEDHRFYQHDGVDVVGFLGTIKDALSGRMRGGSTITMQLVGNMHPDEVSRRDKSIDRKLREQAAAREMERHYSKQQILEAYLNTIEFGHGWYGVDAAARHYFGVPASRVTLAQAATLAAIPKGPALYDPLRHPERAQLRRNLVLTLMQRQGLISSDQADSAKREPVVTLPDARTGPAPYAVDAAAAEAERDGITVMDGGYKVYTTVDPVLQQDAVSALDDGLDKMGLADLQGMVVAVDPTSGEIRALVGGRDYLQSSFDRALGALRQPGSAFKPIVYTQAIIDSIPANATVYDTALAIPLNDGSVYRPEDDDKQFLGAMTLREALTRSRNAVAVQLAERVGLDTLIDLAKGMGITTPLVPFPSTAIGASAVHPIELVGAYAVFDNGGLPVTPHLVTRIDDRAGRPVWASPPGLGAAVIDSGVAFIVRDMMRDVVERGTAASIRKTLPAVVPAAGKTGTTNDNSDVWFVGMTPDLVAGVWVGFDEPHTIAPGAAGGTLAAPIWARMMAGYYQDRDVGGWTPPASLVTAELDRTTGQLADDTTPPERRYTEYFLPGTQPVAFDPRSIGVITLP